MIEKTLDRDARSGKNRLSPRISGSCDTTLLTTTRIPHELDRRKTDLLLRSILFHNDYRSHIVSGFQRAVAQCYFGGGGYDASSEQPAILLLSVARRTCVNGSKCDCLSPPVRVGALSEERVDERVIEFARLY